MTRNRQILDIFSDLDLGVTTDAQALERFDRIEIRGTFNRTGRFIGYDYFTQRWIVMSRPSAAPRYTKKELGSDTSN